MTVNGQFFIWFLFLIIRQTFMEPVSERYYTLNTELEGKLCGSSHENTFEDYRTLNQCASKCLANLCFSFFYNERSQQCVTNGRTYTADDIVDCENSADMVYYVKESIGEYVGCYTDAPDRAMPGGSIQLVGLTVDLCIERCKGIGTSYAGLQNGRECFCANEYAKHGPTPESDCNMACPGQSTEMCGGDWTNSVWKIY